MKPAPGVEVEKQPTAALFACLLVNEAANDGEAGMSAVAQVIINRLHKPQRYGDTIAAVILQPWQFSCLNRDVRHLFLDVERFGVPAYRTAETVVARALTGTLENTVGSATHYCTNGAHGTLPLWGHDDAEYLAAGHTHPHWYSKQMIESGQTYETATIGRQTFGCTS